MSTILELVEFSVVYFSLIQYNLNRKKPLHSISAYTSIERAIITAQSVSFHNREIYFPVLHYITAHANSSMVVEGGGAIAKDRWRVALVR